MTSAVVFNTWFARSPLGKSILCAAWILLIVAPAEAFSCPQVDDSRQSGSGGVDAPAPQVANDVEQGPKKADATEIEFTESRWDPMREGYATLEWNRVDGAAEYELLDSIGSVVYRGVLTKAFLSGLPDGRYQYHVRAIDENNQVLASSTVAAELQVEHWSTPLFLSLFAIGLVVVLAVAAVLISGAKLVEPNHGAEAAEATQS